MKPVPILLLCLAGIACSLAVPGHAQSSTAPLYGLPYMARFDQLPLLKDAVCKQVSSYDRSGGNGDTGHYLNGDAGHLPNDTALLADLKGPGCVYRLWSANAAGFIRFYFDGESAPRIACPMQDLFQDRYPPFTHPLAGQSSGGWYSYLPIPYARSLRIEVEHPAVMYYHVEYHTYPAGTEIRSFTREMTAEDKTAYQTVVSNWDKRGQIPLPLPDRLAAVKGETTLKQGHKTVLLRERRGGTLRGLHVKVDPADRFTLRALTLRAYWDGAVEPGVEAPLGDFFGVGFGEQKFKALPVAMSDAGYDCFFPMPFGKSARIEVANDGRTPVRISWQADVDERAPDMDRSAYFHAKWRRTLTESGKHVTLLETSGRGHYVGVNLNMQGDRGIGFLEGDEKIYVDGETFPSIYGTGTEDYFTGGWYFDKGPFSLAYHGCVVKDDAKSRISAYRYQITDCVPFRKNIRVDIEHGGTNDYPGADYCYTSYWYQDSPSDHWAPLPDLQARHPASIRARGVVEAESLKISGGEVVGDDVLPVEASNGQAVAARGKQDSRMALEFDAPSGSYYSLALGILKSAEGGRVQASLDGKPVGPVIDTYAEKPEVARVDLGLAGLLAKGSHTLVLETVGRDEQSRGQQVVVDYLGLRKQLYPGALEGERARILERTPNVPLDTQAMEGFGEKWSGDAQLWFRPTSAGAFFTLQLPVAQAGRYHLTAYFTKAADYGQVQVSLDGKPRGAVFEGYHEGVEASGRVDLGEVELTQGNHRLRFTVTGKNPRSTNYLVGLDAVVLEPVR